jgi:two-component system CheB/CheR fusion protein
MKAGAADFIEKPITRSELLASLNSALEQSRDLSKLFESRETVAATIASLTPRQHQIMDMVLADRPSTPRTSVSASGPLRTTARQ